MVIKCITECKGPRTTEATKLQGTFSNIRKTIERKRLEISSQKLEMPREHFMQGWAQ